MKLNKQIITYLLLFIGAAAIYRIIPGRPFGFAPQIAMAVFGGAVLKDRKWAFALPLFSMFVSDALYQLLYLNGLTTIQGFYSGQLLNYAEIASVVFIGMLIRKVKLSSIILASLAAPTWFFLLSNFTVWAGLDNNTIPRSWAGLLEVYTLGIPFYQASIAATLLFNGVFFGAWYWVNRRKGVQTV